MRMLKGILGKNDLCCMNARWLIAICNGGHKVSLQWLIWAGNVTHYVFLWMSSLDEGIETALKLSSDIKLGRVIDILEGRTKTENYLEK